MKRCITCGRNTRKFAEFPCPTCGTKIVRCYDCRENKNEYKCACGFMGP
ncbi:MAG: zinc finger domain-containing protein [Candidatus Micrarchaeia archaeon]